MSRSPRFESESAIEANLTDWANAPIAFTKATYTNVMRPQSRFALAFSLALLVHAILFVLMGDLMRLPSTNVQKEHVIQLRLIDKTLPVLDPTPVVTAIPESAPQVPIPEAAPHASSVAAVKTAAKLPSEVVSTVESPSAPMSNPELNSTQPSRAISEKLFRRDGSIVLPDLDASRATSDFDSRTKITPFAKNPMNHPSPLPYKPTMFEKDWAPLDETPLGALVRKATVSKTWDTEGGTRISCTSFLLFSGCGWGPTPRMPIEELKRMRANPPMPRPLPTDES